MRDVIGYFAILHKDKKSGAIGVRFPDHPNIITYGRDREEAIEMAEEALNATLETEFDRHLSLPAPSKRPNVKKGEKAIFVPLTPEVRMAFLLRAWREEAGLTQGELAKRLGISVQAYQRMERPGRSNLTVDTLNRIAQALGRQLVVEAR